MRQELQARKATRFLGVSDAQRSLWGEALGAHDKYLGRTPTVSGVTGLVINGIMRTRLPEWSPTIY
jgi:hypothetical protein